MPSAPPSSHAMQELSDREKGLNKGKAAVVSLRYNAAHVSYLIGIGKAFRHLGYEVDYLLAPEYARFRELSAIAPIVPVNGNGLCANGHSQAVFLNPSIQNHSAAGLLKRSGARILYVYHEPWKYSLEYLIGEGPLRWARIALAHQASKLMLKVSDAVILPSRYAASMAAWSPLDANRPLNPSLTNSGKEPEQLATTGVPNMNDFTITPLCVTLR